MKIWDKLFHREDKKFNKFDWLTLGGGLAVFTAISLGNISRWSIWFDEAFSVYLIRFNFSDIAKYTALDVHPPLYYWVLKLWQMAFGNSELALRSLSLVFIAIAIIFVYMLIRKTFGMKAAGWSMLFLALSPMLLRYSEEARMYGMVMAIVAAATYVLVSAHEKPTRLKWIVYGILVALGMWTHYFTALIWIAHWVWRYIAVRGATAKKVWSEFFSKDWILAHAVALAAFLPWLPIMAKQLGGIQKTGFWIDPVSITTPFNFLTNLLMYRDTWEVTGWYALLATVALIALLTMIFKTWPMLKNEQKQSYSLILSIAIVPIVMLIILSLPPLRPAFVERYLLAALPFWAALIGVSVAVLMTKKQFVTLTRLAVVVLVIAMSAGIFHLYSMGNYNKDEDTGYVTSIRYTVREVQKLASDGQPIIAPASGFLQVHYYSTDRNPVYFDGNNIPEWGSMEMLRQNDYRKAIDIEGMAKDVGGKIWYVGSWTKDSPAKPSVGEWKVIRTVNEPSLPNNAYTVRAVELELVSD